ncbi:MAG: anthranilate synthase component II [Planctomycetota bacterium]|jgi:anthranilate synthase/aminodeoxychorismate synthase-like glutamine amidotransferase
MIVLIDNYDSFVYNLAQYLGEFRIPTRVFRNDAITEEEIRALAPTHILISPGPCTPKEAGISNDVIRAFAGEIPILGVCLGHQCIGEVFGGTVVKAPLPVHGKRSFIRHDGRTLFRGLPNPLEAGRYHSLVVDPDSVPDDLALSAWTDSGIVMGLRHRRWNVQGIQVHPESILTHYGHDILGNFLLERRAIW